LPSSASVISWLNGLVWPLWVLMTRTLPPQIRSALTAAMTSRTSAWNAASSMQTTPCRPRMFSGRDDSASTRKPEAKRAR